MNKTCAKTGGRETLKDGIVSKLQRHIVSQRKLLISFFFLLVHFISHSVIFPHGHIIVTLNTR